MSSNVLDQHFCGELVAIYCFVTFINTSRHGYDLLKSELFFLFDSLHLQRERFSYYEYSF